MNYQISANGKQLLRLSSHWDGLIGYFSITAMDARTGAEIANEAFNALDSLASAGHSAHGRCHRAAIWPDGVKTMSDGSIVPLDSVDRLAIFTVVLRRIMKMGLSNYHSVFKVTPVA